MVAAVVDIIFALSVIAAAFALYHRIQAGRSLKRLIKMVEEQNKRREQQEQQEKKD